ncbi:hypothetical protein B0H14DRAFT_3091353 [Mycena olivaceomarginata]|nr:hypothetical protein B0H14DRAFT_3091353 [Mycena olivaceomarginata]
MLEMTHFTVQDLNGTIPSDADIWISIRDKDIINTIWGFLWKCCHQGYKGGTHWRNIPVDDAMEHILLECNAPGQAVTWNLCKELWLKKHLFPPTLKIGTILGCISESAYLGLSLRCERVISRGNNPEKYHSGSEIHNRWVSRMNRRLKMEQLLTDIGRRRPALQLPS